MGANLSALSGTALGAALLQAQGCTQISKQAPSNASEKVGASFVSYSIELTDLPYYAGNKSTPNNYSSNLLQNLARAQGAMPVLRIGGNTQDTALYDKDLKNATITVDGGTMHIGPSFYESFSIFPNTTYIYGLNFDKTGDAARSSLLDTVTQACKTLGKDKLEAWEYGNEPDYLNPNGRGPNYTEAMFVEEWLNGTAAIQKQLEKSCPELANGTSYGYISPSWSGPAEGPKMLKVKTAFADGLAKDKDIRQISVHNYIDGATSPGVTRQGTLMNHTRTVQSVSAHNQLASSLKQYDLPYILGEFNSLYNGGKSGVSDSFGAALWAVDFTLYCAATNISRTHMHVAAEAPYKPWHAVASATGGPPATKAPYYGNLMAATMIGDSAKAGTQIAEIPLKHEQEIAYAAYEDGHLARLAIINMQEFNSTSDSDGAATTRPKETYEFQVLGQKASSAKVQRLFAAGSDVTTGITFDQISYDYDKEQGKGAQVGDKSGGPPTIEVQQDGTFKVDVMHSEAVIVVF